MNFTELLVDQLEHSVEITNLNDSSQYTLSVNVATEMGLNHSLTPPTITLLAVQTSMITTLLANIYVYEYLFNKLNMKEAMIQ